MNGKKLLSTGFMILASLGYAGGQAHAQDMKPEEFQKKCNEASYYLNSCATPDGGLRSSFTCDIVKSRLTENPAKTKQMGQQCTRHFGTSFPYINEAKL